MTVLVWDRLEDRRYETGIERGVLYPVGESAVAWNGLVSVEETKSRESKVYYQDGIKIFERLIAPDYAAKIQAVTYPNELDRLMGNQELNAGVNLHGQRGDLFHLSYRTRIGSALDGVDHGYKLHLVYNLLINPDDTTHESISDDPDLVTFGWAISGTPSLWNNQPANHISLDSTTIDPAKLTEIEDQLYGTAGTDPVMPDLETLLNSF